MTLNETVQPWAPGARREERFVRIELPSGLPHGVSAEVLAAPEGAPAVRVEHDGAGRVSLSVQAAASGGVRALFRVPTVDAVVLWKPGSSQDRSHVPPSWADAVPVTPFTGACLGSLLGRHDAPIVTFGAGAGSVEGSGGGFGTGVGHRPVALRAGMIEETAEFLIVVECDASDAPLTVHLDFSGDDFAGSVAAMGRALGFARPQVSAANEEAILCTWYSFHQDLDVDRLLADARIGSRLGFGTVTIDDGWQNLDADRGYGSCGDWIVEPAKIPDGPGLVRALADLGLRTMWWVGTPFIGYRSEAYRNAHLPMLFDEPSMEAAILDPRSPLARRHLVDRLLALVETTGADGLKVDFLERFAVNRTDDAPADADIAEPESAALVLLDELNDALAGVRDHVMIEFREPYVSPATIGRATMFRVGDCPLSPVQNRLGIIDMRLMTTGIAIHSDPIMWSVGDSPERVAQQLLSGLFGVPQVSVDLERQSERQLAVLAFWLGFWRERRQLLLHGGLRPIGVHHDYEVVEASDGTDIVTVRYSGVGVRVPAGEWRTWHLVNADEDGVVVEDGQGRFDVRVLDCTGDPVADRSGVELVLAPLPIPAGGVAVVTRAG